MAELVISPPAASTTNGRTDAFVGSEVATELRNAFLLGATISELQGRIRLAALDGSLGSVPDPPSEAETSVRAGFVPYVDADSSIARATSTWRVLFERLSMLHHAFFPDSTTSNTHYDPGTRLPPYFFPDQPDYADIGIAPEPEGAAILANFRLREVTRRGLNSLMLLCIAPEISLLPDVIREQQERLIGSMPASAEGVDPREAAISLITQQILLFLHAWEGFLRESFFSVGVSALNENNLIAFEGGLSMAWLSWGISCESLEHPDASPASRAAVWDNAFRDSAINRLQHQVSIVGKALDDALAVVAGAPTTRSELATFAVKRSLDYWQRTVRWLGKRQSAGQNQPDWEKLRLALIEQTGIWQALVLGQQNVECYDAEGVCQHILQDLAPAFERLAAGRGLFGAATAVGQQLTEEVRLATTQMEHAAGTLVRSFWPLILAFAGIAVLGAIFFFVHLQTSPGANVLADLATLGVGAAGALGLAASRLGLRSAATSPPAHQESLPPTANAAPNLLDRLSSLGNEVGTTILADLNRGFDKVQADLKRLGYCVGVSYPLVEFFVLDDEWKDFRSDVNFMDKVIWNDTDRREELVQVASAAFGPLGFFAISTSSAGSGAETADQRPA